MTELLSPIDKASIILNRIRNIQSNKFYQEILLIELNSLEDKNENMLSLANSELQNCESKLLVLQQELDSLNLSQEDIDRISQPSNVLPIE